MQVTLNQAATLVRTAGGTNTFLIRGAPGVGKSSILSSLAREMPDYLACYVDVANLDLGDLGMPVIDRESMTTSYAPSARFGIGKGQTRPVLLMLDELGKASRPVLNMLLPVILEHRLGDVMLPTGSIVFGTTNLDTDGVGDNIPAHAFNRMTVLDMANPTADEWLGWAANNDIAPEVMAFARDYPQVFDRYDLMDAKDKNPYVFNPLTGNTRAFCSPRSLEKASHLVKQREVLGQAMLPALCGTVGESAARDLEANVMLSDSMPTMAAILASPSTCKLPDGAGAYFLMALRLAQNAKPDTFDAIMTYTGRFASFEAHALFVTQLASNKAKVSMACKNAAFTSAAAKLGRFI